MRRTDIRKTGQHHIAGQLAQSMVALALASLLVGCTGYHKIRPGSGRYADARTPSTLYVGAERKTVWMMTIASGDLITDWIYGRGRSTYPVFEPPPWSDKTAARVEREALPWQHLGSGTMNNLYGMAEATIPREFDAERREYYQVVDNRVTWVVSIDPLVFANHTEHPEITPACPCELDEQYGPTSVYLPRDDDFDCVITSIVAYTGEYPERVPFYPDAIENDIFRELAFETPMTLGNLLDQPEIWANLLE